LISEAIWKPLGAQHDAFIGVDSEGSSWCGGGFCATARDFAMIGDMVLNHGRHGSQQIIPSTWINDLSAGGDLEAWKNGAWGRLFSPISPNMSYRSGWYTIHDDPELLFTMGVHGQNLFLDRKNNIAVAKLSSWPQREDPRRTGLTHLAIRELRRCLSPKGQ
jgi:CubicO group peptidase (beta-lactamase class C family)